MEQQEKSIGIMGLGNLLLGDEGFGIHCIQYLEEHYQLPKNVEVIDGGTGGILLAPFIEEHDELWVIDVVDLEDEPGSVHYFTDVDVRSGDIQTRMSPHQIGMLDILDICRIRGKVPQRVHFIAVVPESLDAGMELTPLLQGRIQDVLQILAEKLGEEVPLTPITYAQAA
ncbi:HyaD/HybD family hydrogenase maturation endopeptidase [Desulfobulbus rhabdoformis]|uniref:HyaD/HybD family hydrogenase maturation endopeptidase n=1 Tax=Desulfobulbus rhabdoformis TaxID=34032 RepID=UPI001965F30B|nr:HyaD/HybD family hydrogenase maturation endopeptidase [Desulfobulbus rhabdoformis]MBM9616296.1 HyaD/HybD family hydrogenase maturation endopeptidase [Desulfobulbus rhabdoformis]